MGERTLEKAPEGGWAVDTRALVSVLPGHLGRDLGGSQDPPPYRKGVGQRGSWWGPKEQPNPWERQSHRGGRAGGPRNHPVYIY